MTVSELIQLLSKINPDIKVVVRGYENGYNDILELKPVKIKQKAHSKDYDGEYADSEDDNASDAINLFGENENASDY